MLGIVGNTRNRINMLDEYDELDCIDEIEGVIDMDKEYITCNTYKNNINTTENENENEKQNQISDKSGIKEIYVDKILLVQRRNTIGMIEFLRGKFDILNNEYIIKLFNMMTFDEKRILREYDSFDMIRTIIGLKREYNYRGEYDEAKRKFNILKQHPSGDQVNILLDKSITKWNSPEWGVPKGRRNHKENDIECAIREFVEETGIIYKNINVYRNIKPLEEIYTGINGVVYKHIYFIADIKDTVESNKNMIKVESGGYINMEVSNVKLFSLSDAHKLIRPYYVSKLNAIKQGFQILKDINMFFE